MDTDDRPHGPYGTEAEARTGAAPLLAALKGAEGGGKTTGAAQQSRRRAAADYLTGTLNRAGVELGAYDTQVADSLTTGEPEALAVIVGWIERAHADGCAEAQVNVAPTDPTTTGTARADLEAEFPDTEA
jgi:hypothetical protein